MQRGLPEPIASDLVAALRDSVGYSVAHTATEALMGALPDFLRRSLMFTLTNVLTRGLTHTIAPTLVSALLKGGRGQLSEAMTATHSFAAYFSDYYSSFYSKHAKNEKSEKGTSSQRVSYPIKSGYPQ